MNDVINKINIPLDKPETRIRVAIKQGNTNSRRIVITLTSHGSVFNLNDVKMAAVMGVKPDGTKFYNDCIVANNEIIYDVTSQTISAKGTIECEVVLFGNDYKKIISARFVMECYENLFDVPYEESKNEYNIMERAVTLCEEERVKTEQLSNQVNDKYNELIERISEYYELEESIKENTQAIELVRKKTDGNQQSLTELTASVEQHGKTINEITKNVTSCQETARQNTENLGTLKTAYESSTKTMSEDINELKTSIGDVGQLLDEINGEVI